MKNPKISFLSIVILVVSLFTCQLNANTVETIIPCQCDNVDAIVCDNFEAYDIGTLGEQSDCWNYFNADALVVSDIVASGIKAINLQGSQGHDMIFFPGNLNANHYKLSFKLFVPNGASAYFNLMHEFSNIGAVLASEVFFDPAGTGTLNAGSVDAATFNYTQDTWIDVVQTINIETDETTLTIDGNYVYSWTFSHRHDDTAGGSLNFEVINFATPNSSDNYYIDELEIEEVVFGEGPCSCNNPDAITCDDFESYSLGEIDEQVNCWTTFTGTETGGIISSDYAISGTKSMKVDGIGNQDVVYLPGNYTSGNYELSFKLYIPENKGAYYNLLHQFDQNIFENNQWAFEVDFNPDGTGSLDAGERDVTSFNYTQGSWMNIVQTIYMDEDLITLKIDGETIFSWPFSYQSNTQNGGMISLEAINFWPAENNYQYWVDDIQLVDLGPSELSISPSTATVPSMATTQDYTINANIDWTITADADWLEFDMTSGEDNAVLTASIEQNPATESRQATITIIGVGIIQTATLIQEGAVTESELTINPSNANVASIAGVFNYEVNSNVDWTISDDASWLDLDMTSGAGNAILAASYEENPALESRQAVITITGGGITGIVTLTQDAAPSDVVLDISPSISNVFAEPFGEINYVVTSNVDWIISHDGDGWLFFDMESGTGNAILTATHVENFSEEERQATITITGGGISKTAILNQAAITTTEGLAITPINNTVPSIAGYVQYSVASNGAWEITDDADWLSINPTEENGGYLVTASYEENPSSSSRQATITLTELEGNEESITAVLTQEGAAIPIVLDITPFNPNVASVSGMINLLVNANVDWTITDNANWLELDNTSGTGNTPLVASFQGNPSAESRQATISLSGGGFVRELVLTQEGDANAAITIANTILNESCFESNDGQISLSVSGDNEPFNYDWSNGMTTKDISGLPPGVYSCIVTDSQNNSISTGDIEVLAAPELVVNIASPDTLNCNLNEIILDASLSTMGPNIGLTWSTADGEFGQANTLNTLMPIVGSPGLYTLTLIYNDNGACQAEGSVEVLEVFGVEIIEKTSTPATEGNADGTASVTASGGTMPYQYAWNTSPVQTTASIEGLVEGTYNVSVTDADDCLVFSSVVVESVPTNTNEIEGLNRFELFPNPSNGKFNMELELEERSTINIKIYDMLGSVVWEKDYENDKVSQVIDLKGLSNAVYFMTLEINGSETTKRIVIEK